MMAKETIYLCNFRVSVEGDWLCLEELDDVHVNTPVVCAAEDGIRIVVYFCMKLSKWNSFLCTVCN